jgi:hypothetical protein
MSSYPEDSKAGFQVMEFALSAGIFLKTKTLCKLRLQAELPLLWRQQLPVAAVNVLSF